MFTEAAESEFQHDASVNGYKVREIIRDAGHALSPHHKLSFRTSVILKPCIWPCYNPTEKVTHHLCQVAMPTESKNTFQITLLNIKYITVGCYCAVLESISDKLHHCIIVNETVMWSTNLRRLHNCGVSENKSALLVCLSSI